MKEYDDALLQQHRPPPNFPPPAPPIWPRPTSGQLSSEADSAYSEECGGGSSGNSSSMVHNPTVIDGGIIRMDLSMNPPVFCSPPIQLPRSIL
jgi:hypothetical protein